MDYAIRITGLFCPPALAYSTEQYRPGVTVQNDGSFANSASGSLRIYDKTSGLLIKTTSIYSGPIPAGDSRVAQSDSYWLPPYEGEFFAIAHLEATNAKADMPPAFFTVSSLPPPPPPTVPAHAEQHEDGAVDELNVSDLSGVLLEGQHPEDHASNHQLSGPDQLNVSGLSGVLAQAQTPAAHGAATHDQSVEATANKGIADGYCGLDQNSLVSFDNLNTEIERIIRCTNPSDEATIDEPSNILDLIHVPLSHRIYVNALVSIQLQAAVQTILSISIAGDVKTFTLPAIGASIILPVFIAHCANTDIENAQVLVTVDPNGGSCFYRFDFIRVADCRRILP